MERQVRTRLCSSAPVLLCGVMEPVLFNFVLVPPPSPQSQVKLVVMKGAGGKAFCAGGDVVGVRQAVLDGVGEQSKRGCLRARIWGITITTDGWKPTYD
jgi:hypothetical protein